MFRKILYTYLGLMIFAALSALIIGNTTINLIVAIIGGILGFRFGKYRDRKYKEKKGIEVEEYHFALKEGASVWDVIFNSVGVILNLAIVILSFGSLNTLSKYK